MLKIPAAPFAAVASARSARELQPYLQEALELEMLVIPPCLTALFSLRDGRNSEIREILRNAAVDEMLHVALIANIMNAIRCPPLLSASTLARGYPARPPLGAKNVELGLNKFSAELGRGVFRAVDQSVNQTSAQDPDAAAGGLGHFYATLCAKIEDLGDSVFIGDPARQFVDAISYSERELFRVHDTATAVRALRLISGAEIDSPGATIDCPGSAHWRRLSQIVGAPKSSIMGAFDPEGVINIVQNSRADMYEPGSPARAAIDAFNVAYCNVLADLNESFNGRPERYERAVSGMYRLTSLARSIVTIDRGDGTFASPSFERC